MSYDHMTTGIDETPETFGSSGEPVPSGWYPLRVVEILDRSKSDAGALQVRLMIKVIEGEHADRNAFVSQTLAPRILNAKGQNKTSDELASDSRKIQGRVKGFLKSCGLEVGQPLGEAEEAVFTMFQVDNWVGSEFMGRLTVRESRQGVPRNELAAFAPMDDPKHGVEWFRQQQQEQSNQGAATGAVVL